MEEGTYVIRDVDQLRMMAHPYRLRIMHDLAKGKFTVTQLAERYGDTPAKVHHHVKKLEKVGLVRLVETREVSGILEKYYEAVAGDFHVEGSLLKTAEAQDSATDSIQRMLGFIYRTAKRGFEQTVASAGPKTGDDEAAGARGLGADRAGTLGLTHVRLRPCEARELSAKLWDVVAQYEKRCDGGERGAGEKRRQDGEEERIRPSSYAVAIIIFPDDPSEDTRAGSSC
ncbi:MAG: ArsR/SmtB family transcription factor [Betaproteobacteria bacterium]